MDITIIGGSLAGLMAGRRLAEAGNHDFLVFEAKPEIGLPLKCGEAVEREALENLFGPTIATEPFIRNEIFRHKVKFKSAVREFSFPYFELDRPAFEKWLARPVESRLRLNARVTEIEKTTNGFRFRAGEQEYETRAILLACGANYSLHEKLGIKTDGTLGYAFGGLYAAHPDERFFVWRVEETLEGYAWSFPKRGGVVNAGTAGLHAKALRPVLKSFLASEAIGEKPERVLGGHYPVTGPLRKTAFDRILVAGDAAGMVYAGTGEGILYALWSGFLAGETLARAQTFSFAELRPYEKAWRMRFEKRLRAGVRFSRLLSLLLKTKHFERVLNKVPEDWLMALLMGRPLPWRAALRISAHQLKSWVGRSTGEASETRR